ncbi:MFS transporter [Tuwongella immobilis]|uniref:Major facilitator superfamily (MFS) profile domain-containing protein n=1 Tax=Tuwongella immobilis TaxID=692036 RepID=A0A6C2YNZ4_9BACT|nr:MFS transporter [Tuwongella immobilis]VIP02775.1 mfs transporter : Sugar phosphate permease OS=Singulisphaera acidiphila (strain ATCC BAA-1392 / DSM 18658 / VKM B-2454 / MOB10) GN=Sinac_0922 PE=4 SV=1: MFS_1 [Tuwongella immobilis]VTS02414.1 mfs transporter : Sugar phosphate permease OS=Singulisphaera acidiphila (strain ATCC BAA-1392 / DSM 18658 / VKM B-2454 / MOB10) GN=Sinac_0922 PE=4 SV=1: MFS_1 [Tuwongella immobilis]
MPSTNHLSRDRVGIISFLGILTFVLYLDRVCIGQAMPFIQEDLGLNKTQQSYILMAFTVAYGLFMVPVGLLGDRFGPKKVMVGIVIWWSIFTALTGYVSGLTTLIIIRFLFGAGEAGALPNSAKLIARWFPPERRGFPQGFMNTAALLGGACAPLVTAQTIQFVDSRLAPMLAGTGIHLVGWRTTFYLFGTLGILWSIGFWMWYREPPAEAMQSRPTPALKFALESARESADEYVPPQPLSWGRVLTSPTVWLMGLINTCASAVSYFYMSWYPSYLKDARGVINTESGNMTTLVLIGGALGSLWGGYLSDWMVRRTGERRWSRSIIGATGMFISAIGLLVAPLFDSAWETSIVLCIGFTGGMLMIAAWWGVVADISGPHVATLFGLMNGLGVFGGAGSQFFAGAMVDHNTQVLGLAGRAAWDPVFPVYAAVACLGGIAWLMVNANRQVHSRTLP